MNTTQPTSGLSATHPYFLRSAIFGALLTILLAVIISRMWLPAPTRHDHSHDRDLTMDWTHHLPVLAQTPGGLLEAATMTVSEDFTDSWATRHLGIYFGTTSAAVQVLATYRYHVPLKGHWSVTVHGSVCLVNAPVVAPSLPVAYDSEKIRTAAENGWARWNKQECLDALCKSITSRLDERAQDSGHLRLARETCRRTVEEFVTRWLVQEQSWRDDAFHQVVVRFEDEAPANPLM